jgi:hypothetical protein
MTTLTWKLWISYQSLWDIRGDGGNRCMGFARGLLMLLMFGLAGCARNPNIIVWQPAQGGQAIHRLVLTSPVGSEELTGPLMAAMEREQPPRDYPLRIMDLDSLAPYQQVQLASYDGRPNDLAIIDAARRAGLQAAIHGEIVYERMEVPEERRWWRRKAPERLTLMWRVVDVTSGQTIAQQAIAVDRDQAVRSYPDLKELSKIDGPQAVYIAAARDSWKWLAPHLGTELAPLVQAGWLPGLPQMLRADTMARQGDWAGAEQQWREVVELHPWHGAAWHNLAIAGVARADFEEAKRCLAKADEGWWLGIPKRDSGVWVERKQRDYHRIFALPEPPGGWRYPEPEVYQAAYAIPSSAPPQDIDQLPWWTAIPLAKPPGWTWRAWLTQPLIL